MEQNNETTALLARADSLGAPRISGQVTVSLGEIDQLRADYVNATKAYKELAMHIKEVRVVLVYGDGSANKIVKDKNFRESISWKNLDDVRSIIALEEKERLQNHIDGLNSQIEVVNQKFLDSDTQVNELKLKIQQMKKEYSEEEKKLKDNIKNLELVIQENKAANEQLEQSLKVEAEYRTDTGIKLEKLKAEFNDLSNKYVALQEEKRWWKFW